MFHQEHGAGHPSFPSKALAVCAFMNLPNPTKYNRDSFFFTTPRLAVQQSTLFDSGGKVGITEFSWNPKNKTGEDQHQLDLDVAENNVTARQEMFAACAASYNVPKCWAQAKYGDVSPAYFIPQ